MWARVSHRLGRWFGAGEVAGGAPTMIVPAGAAIERDDRGRLCVRAPGNLVLQGSGSYGQLESVGGSIRIEPGVRIEAAEVRCAGVCSVAGTLLAWKIVARELHVEGGGEASFVLRDTHTLRVDPPGRIVGNFASEAELMGLFSRFASEVRALPRGLAERNPLPLDVGRTEPAPRADGSGSWRDDELPVGAVMSLIEAASHEAKGPRARILSQITKLLEGGELDTLRSTWRVLFERLEPLDPVLAQARTQLEALLVGEEKEVASGTE